MLTITQYLAVLSSFKYCGFFFNVALLKILLCLYADIPTIIFLYAGKEYEFLKNCVQLILFL